MKRILFFLVILPFFTLQSQETKKQTAKHNISIGFNFSPDYSYRSLHNKNGNQSGDAVKKTRNDMEVAKFGYSTGLNICFAGSGRMSIETGVQYSSKGYQTKNYDLVYGGPDPTAPVKAQSVYFYQYIGIPLRAKLTLGRGYIRVPIKKRTPGNDNLRFLLSAGFMTNFLVNIKHALTFEYADGRKEEHKVATADDFKKIDISPMISAGIDCGISNKIRFTAEPTFRYGIINTKDAPLTESLWSIGLNLGIYYSLK